MRPALLLLLASAWTTTACGAVTALPTDGATVSDAAQDGAPADAPVIDAAGLSCEALVQTIDARRPTVLSCCPICRVPQCAQLVDDLCCPISATSPDPAFVAAVAEYKRRCPPRACPAIVCRTEPSRACEPVSGTPSTGACVP